VSELVTKPDAQSGRHLFVSYAATDRERALAIADVLEAGGITVWIDRRGLAGGDLWAAEITAAIRSCKALLLVCTAASVRSRNVRQEIQLAWDHDRPILPFLLEPVQFPDEIAYFLQGRQWIDITNQTQSDWVSDVVHAVRGSPRTTFAGRSPQPAEPEPPATTLPVPPTPIIGRDTQISDICAILQRRTTQLVTLVGPGGVGKTRLALAAAWQIRETFRGAMHFVNLALVRDPELVLPAIAETVGLSDAGQQSLITRLITTLRDQSMLLVLDNCEQVLEAAGDIGELMAGLPELTVLATSREPLRLRAEQTVEVAPLSIANESRPVSVEEAAEFPAVKLFVARASSAKPGFALTKENSKAVTEICQRLDGLPLAIELAASRSSLLTPDLMLSRLEKRLPLLTGGARDLPARQRTLRDAIIWSEELLTAEERAVLRRLSVFVGGFTLESALAVTDTPGNFNGELDVLQAMERLVGHSLLREVVSEEDEVRFQMLETIREFGLERLEESGEAQEAHQRHARWCLEVADTAAPELTGPNQQQWLRRLRLEQDNLRAALAWAVAVEPASALRLCAALLEFWIATSAFQEGALWCDRSLQAGVAEHSALVAETTYAAARIAYRQGNEILARQHGKEALRLFEQLGDDRGIALAMAALGISQLGSDDVSAGIAMLGEALERIRPLGDLHHTGTIANNLAMLKLVTGDLVSALDLFMESAAMDRALGDKLTLALTVANIVEVMVKLDRAGEALPLLREVVEDQRQLRHRANVGHLLDSIALALSAHGERTLAVRLYGAADMEHQLTRAGAMPEEQETFLVDIERLCEELGMPAFDAAWSGGRALTYDDAMEEAREALDAWEAQANA
jgi:predicted ATPase